jgi:hypothetical protein
VRDVKPSHEYTDDELVRMAVDDPYGVEPPQRVLAQAEMTRRLLAAMRAISGSR